MKCKNCIHYECCCDWVSSEDLKDLGTGENCATYKDKSLCVELPCRCAECEHLTVMKSNKIYAKCEKTGLEFLPFEIDTREHYCSFAKLKEKKNEE